MSFLLNTLRTLYRGGDTPMQNTTPQDQPKRYQCHHIFADGHHCGSAALRNEQFCYYHHTTRRPAANPRARRAAFDLPLPEDRSAIQAAIGQVLQRITANDLDPRRAGLLLYGLQIRAKREPLLGKPSLQDWPSKPLNRRKWL